MYYLQKLKEVLSLKQKKNPGYSLRAFARDLEIHPSTLGHVLNGKRMLPLKQAPLVAQKLELTPQEKTLFMESFYRSKTSIDNIQISQLDERVMLDEAYYHIIAEWEYFAVLELFRLENTIVSKEKISEKLKISSLRADIVLQNLLKANLIAQKKDKSFFKVNDDIRTTEDIQSKALIKSHQETLEIASQKLNEIETELRDFSSETIAVDISKLSEAKTIIREFRQKMCELLRDGHKQDVYMMAIQLFPLTTPNKNL